MSDLLELKYFCPLQGIELANEYTALLTETLKEVIVDNNVAVYAHGSFAREELTTLSDADIIILGEKNRREKYPSKLIDDLHSIGYKDVDMPPWSTPEQLIRQGMTEIVDKDKVEGMRFLFGNEEVDKKLWEYLNTITTTSDDLYKYFLVKSWYRSLANRKNPMSIVEPNLKHMQGGLRWDFLFITQSFSYVDPLQNKEFRTSLFRRADEILYHVEHQRFSDTTPLEFPGESFFYIGSDPRKVSKSLITALDFLIGLRDANQVYSLEHELNDYDKLTEQAQRYIASSMGIKTEELIEALMYHREVVANTADELDTAMHICFSKYNRSQNWWKAIWEPVVNEIRSAIINEREINKGIISVLKENDDPIIKLAYVWFSKDKKTLRVFAENIIDRGYLVDSDWPYLVGLTRNKETPIEIFERFSHLVKLREYKWRSIAGNIEKRLGRKLL